MERLFYITLYVKADVEQGVRFDTIVDNFEYSITFNGKEATILDTSLKLLR